MKDQFTNIELKVIIDSLNSVGWQALPVKHPERVAAESALRKAKALHKPEEL